jgi:hypothetical protein
MSMADPLGFEVKVVHTNVLSYAVDLFVLVYPQEWTTLGQQVIAKLPANSPLTKSPPRPGTWKIFPSEGAVKAKSILVVGAPSFHDMNYDAIRQVGRQIIIALTESAGDPEASHVGVTILGPGGGLDEVEALRAMMFGFLSAIEDQEVPKTVRRISIVENKASRAEILSETLDRFWQKDARTFAASLDLPDDLIETDTKKPAKSSAKSTGNAQVSRLAPPPTPDHKRIVLTKRTHRPVVPIATLNEPSVFVAMPFSARYNDIYYYAILPSIKANHCQCIRLDKVIYTGDVIETIKKRIQSAKLMVALLDDFNPNVFLEIGFAWGVETPVLLLVSDDQLKNKLPFDVASYRYVSFDSIRQLADRLPDEIHGVIGGSVVIDN